MTRHTIRSTRKRMNELERQAADQFDSTILHNRVYEAIGQADEIRRFVDVTQRAYELQDDQRIADRVQKTAFGAAEDLNDEVNDIVQARIASECANVIEDARDGWFDDHAEDEEIEAAFQEACTWLVKHRDVACDADLDVDALVWDETDDEQEVSA